MDTPTPVVAESPLVKSYEPEAGCINKMFESGKTTEQKIVICLFDEGNMPCRALEKKKPFRNSLQFMRKYTTILTESATE